jgi:ankyrin repeat protein
MVMLLETLVACAAAAEAAALLIESGARVNARDGEGRTALARAIDAGQPAVAELLRRHGGRL